MQKSRMQKLHCFEVFKPVHRYDLEMISLDVVQSLNSEGTQSGVLKNMCISARSLASWICHYHIKTDK